MKDAKLKSILITVLMSILCIVAVYAGVTLNHPNSEWSRSNSVLFNFTPAWNNTVLDWCSIWTNYTGSWAVSGNYSGVSNGTEYTPSIGMSDTIGNKTLIWRVKCANASAEGFSALNYTFGVDGTTPTIALSGVADTSYVGVTTVPFVYTPTDPSNLDTCLLYHNLTGTWHNNETNATANGAGASGVARTVARVAPADGKYIWNVYCNDSATNNAWAEDTNRSFTVDTTLPAPVKFITANDSYWTNQTPEIRWNSTTDANFWKYELRISNYLNMSDPFQTITITTITSNATTLTSSLEHEGVYYMRVLSYDYAGHTYNTSVLYYYLDLTSPTVTINAPANNTYTSDTTPDFNVTIVDTYPANCTLYMLVNGTGITPNNTLAYVSNNTETNLTSADGLPEGAYYFNIECNDRAGHSVNGSRMANGSVTHYNLTIDTTSPTTPNMSVSSDAWFRKNNTDKTPRLEWELVSETNFLKYMVRAHYITNNSVHYETNVTAITTTYAYLSLATNNSYNFSVTAYDKAGNTNYNNTGKDIGYFVDHVCGTLNVGWNLCGATWTTDKKLSLIGNETGALFVSVWNLTHQWATCNSGVDANGQHCDVLTGISNLNNHAVWVYVNQSTEWKNRTWVANAYSSNITLFNATAKGVSPANGWNLESGFIRNGRVFGHLKNTFGINVTMFSMPYNNGTSVPYVNSGAFAALNNNTRLDYGRGIWLYYNGTKPNGNQTMDVGGI